MSALDILGVLLDDKDLCYNVLYPPNDIDYIPELYRLLPCPEPEIGFLLWKMRCIGKMIMASDISDIREDTIK